MLKARKCLAEMREYQSPLTSPAPDLRLDLNENTSGCSPRVLARLRSIKGETIALYPAREAGEKLVAAFLGLQPAQVLLTNGADEAIDLLCRAYLEAGDETVFVVPAFAMYEIFAQAEGAKAVPVPAGPDYRFPADGILKAITPRTRLVVITNPNNPTGTIARRTDVLRIFDAAPQAAVLLDEAYFDFCGETLLDQVGTIPNLFVARTFSKAYGLAGMRLGVLAGASEQILMLRRVCPPFNVNVFALECLSEALADRDFVESYVRQVASTREWLRRELELLGFKCWRSYTNFVLVNFGDMKDAILEAMRAQGIALRDRPDCPGCVRISIGSQREMDRVLAVVEPMVSKTKPRSGVSK
jgi:histidinol-phosphate aminotransferase